jgi:hypothetical protein
MVMATFLDTESGTSELSVVSALCEEGMSDRAITPSRKFHPNQVIKLTMVTR